jgi:hypothetical protein
MFFLDFAFRLSRLDLPCTPHAFFPERLSNNCCRLSDPSRNPIRPNTRLQIKDRKKSASPPSHMKFCTLTPKTCQYYQLPLHRATTTVVQMASPVLEIMDDSGNLKTTNIRKMERQNKAEFGADICRTARVPRTLGSVAVDAIPVLRQS